LSLQKSEEIMIKSKRSFILGTTAFAAVLCASTIALAQPKEVKVAVAVPLSGAWARSGELHVKGAELAIEHINAAGGIKALGGAKMRLVVVDTGDSTEKAKNAAQRLVSQEPDVVGGTGAFVSSFTLAVTEVTERAELPWLTLSYSEVITGRGYKYVFQTSMTAGAQAENALPVLSQVMKSATGATPKTIGIVMDNTASPVAFTKPMREGGFDKLGLKLVVDEVYTPPLSDATSMVQKVRNARPDMLLVLTTNVPDTKIILEKMNEMGIGKGRIPVVSNGSPLAAPELLKIMDKSLLEGLMVTIANFGGKGHEAAVADWKKKTGELWMTQDAISTYGDMWIFKEAIEKAGSADRKKVAEAMRAMDTTGGSARFFPGSDRMKFDPSGRRVGAELVILQWQNGEPRPVYPESLATAKVNWPKK
jgi:branched-chain amino acid transport system substrate-binding protein